MAQGLFNLKQVNQAISQSAWSSQKTPAVDFLVVAGGGGAGASNPGGAGAGGVTLGTTAITPGSAIAVTIGAGGSGTSGSSIPGNGSNSVFGSVVAIGGGRGANASTIGGDGGSGGGAGSSTANGLNGSGTPNQGFRGGTTFASPTGSSGGGGAGGVGQSPRQYNVGGQGGNGLGSVITGNMTGYGGGGAGATGDTGVGTSVPSAAYGGGGALPAPNGGSGGANTGGGGTSAPSYTGGSGGSGIVVISYPDTYAAPTSTTGSPTVSTSGSGSIAFNGTSQALIYPSSTNYAFGTGDFTVEMFVYRSNTGGILLDARSGALSETWAMYCRNSTKLGWYTGPLDVETPSDIPLNSWAHIAACRSGTTTRLFINGVLETSFTDITNYTTTNTLKIGRNAGGGNFFAGNMSNIRITKGVALYTSGFTVPTAPLSRSASTGLLLSAMSGSTYADFSGNATITTAEGSSLWSSSSPFATGLGYKNRVYTWTSSGSITF